MTEIYKDPTASIDERVSDLIGRMTLDEKVAQLGAIWVTSLVVDEQFDPDQAAEVLSDGIGQVTRIGASTGLLANESAQLANSIQKVLVENTRQPCTGPSRWPRTARGLRRTLRGRDHRSGARFDDEQLLVDRRRARCRDS